MKKLSFLIILLNIMISAQTENPKLKLPSLFSDNMVSQQKTGAAIWGTAGSNEKITVKGSWGKSVSVKSNHDGTWLARIKTPKAGGPYILSVTNGKDLKEFKNVLSGEVWLCSGQSNMEIQLSYFLPLSPVNGTMDELKKSDYPNLRMFTVGRNEAAEPLHDIKGQWKVYSAENALQFSATAFYFGRKLVKELNVPVGLINSSWGGTPVETWISGKALSTVPGFKKMIDELPSANRQRQTLLAWLNQMQKIDLSSNTESMWQNLNVYDSTYSQPLFNDANWLSADMPQNYDALGLERFDGVVWFRKQIEIPEAWLNKNLVLSLGAIDDMDVTYVNGVKVGGYEKGGYYNTPRVYNIPAEVVKDKKLTIAVRTVDNGGGGGFYTNAANFHLQLKDTEEKLPLAGQWKYLPAAEFRNSTLFIFGEGETSFAARPKIDAEVIAGFPSVLYNAMISPLIPYSIKGAIWYQGESNCAYPEGYKTTFPLLIKSWRSEWGTQFPFYYTQIAPYQYGDNISSQLLREVQFNALSIPKTGMAVTMDIGTPADIHPFNKKDVGERLALWALYKDYGKKVVCSGPLYKSCEAKGNELVVSFDNAKGLKLVPVKGKNNLQVAGDDKVFHDAQFRIKNNKLILWSDKVKEPKAARYCWDNISLGTLFNGAGLPSSSFRTDNWTK